MKQEFFMCKIDASVLKEITKVISTINSEFKLKVTKEGLTTRIIDPAHIAMIDLNIKKEATEEYGYIDDLDIGIDVDKLNTILKTAKKGDVVKIKYNNELNTLDVTIGFITRSMGLIDTEGMPDPKFPNLELPAKIVINSRDLNEAIKACSNVSDHLTLFANKEKFRIFAKGDVDKVNVEIEKDLLHELTSYNQFSSKFSIDYFYNMSKNIKKDQLVTLKINNENPLQMEFKINQWVEIKYLLAPKIEND